MGRALCLLSITWLTLGCPSCVIDTLGPEAQELPFVFTDHDGETAASEDSTPLCVPHEARCPALLVSEVCAWDGQSWETGACKSGEVCQADLGGCVPVMCDPFATECTGDKTLRSCSGDGLAWEGSTCDSDHYCVGGYCLYGHCLGHVLLLIDRSSSMKPHWQVMRESVLKLVAQHQQTRFGLMAFPGDEKCSVPGEPAIPLTLFGKKELFEAYFDMHGPGISTPLLFGLQQVRAHREEIFAGQGGVLVVISDGEDTCLTSKKLVVEGLEEEVQGLSAAGVQTYVIGYNYQGDSSQLDAIARHGNTGRDTYVRAGDESELDDAFSGIVSDIKLCL